MKRVTLERLLGQVDECQDEIIQTCQDLIRIPTINYGTADSGDELLAAEYLRSRFRYEGIDAKIYETRENRGNLIAHLGADAKRRLLLMSHTDVVPIEDESEWSFPPFGAQVSEGRIWGRGAIDMKSTVASQVMAMALLKRGKVKLNGQLVLAACADEESGGAYGCKWQSTYHPETMKADFAINEGSGDPVHADNKLVYQIATGEKGRAEIVFNVGGRSWHPSQPWRADNAIYRAEEVIRRIRTYSPEVRIDSEVFDYLEALTGIGEKVTVHNLEDVLQRIDRTDLSLASTLRACSRMTLVATMIKAGVKSNSVAGNCTLTCDVRTLPSQDISDVRDLASQIIDGLDGVSFQIVDTAVSNSSPFDTMFRQCVEQATREALSDYSPSFTPGLTVGFTDSRFVRPLGNVTYGFIPTHPGDDPTANNPHGINESVSINSLITATKFYIALAYRVLN